MDSSSDYNRDTYPCCHPYRCSNKFSYFTNGLCPSANLYQYARGDE